MEIYYGELSWVLTTICKGIKTDEDYKMLEKKGVFEWLLNLINMPYLKERLRELIYFIFYKVQRVADDGGLNLISRNGIVSFFEVLLECYILECYMWKKYTMKFLCVTLIGVLHLKKNTLRNFFVMLHCYA